MDNIKLNNYEPDIIPTWTQDYMKCFSNNLDLQCKKFLFGLYSLYLLIGESFFISPSVHIKSREFLRNTINNLYIPNIIKEFYIELFCTSNKKPYFDNVLDEIASEKIDKLEKPHIYYIK